MRRFLAYAVLAFAVAFGILVRGAASQTLPAIRPTVPGAINPAVTQDNIHSTICVPGWSSKQRPPTSYTEPLKKKLLAASGYADRNLRDYELDHDISIENGGSPTSTDNLWLEPYTGPCNAHIKDRLENALHRLACSGKITLAEDRAAFTDWIAAYNKYVGPLSCPASPTR